LAGETSTFERIRQQIAIDDVGRVCRDIPESACKEEPRNFLKHVISLTLTKSADGLVDPKLVLSWLMTSLGVPAFLLGFLVPVRESGALLPQLFTAAAIRKMPVRKFVWSAGSLFQGLAVLGIFAAALTLDGAAAGWTILGCLSVLAVSRSLCSVAYKDVLGKTVSKSRRGSVTGLAGSISAAAVILFALLLSSGLVERFHLVVFGLAVAGAAWIVAALAFSTLKEESGATEGGANAVSVAFDQLSLLRTDRQLRIFILARALLTATALAPPFMVAASSTADGVAYRELGFLVLASSGAALVSSYVWGRLADRSSRKVLIFSGLLGALAILGTGLFAKTGGLTAGGVLPALLFLLMIAYQGVRLGRSTQLVDMGDQDTRAAYTALSNTVIGVVLLLGSGFSAVAAFAGEVVNLAILALASLCGGLVATGLDEVQSD